MTEFFTYQELDPLLKTSWLGRRAVIEESLPSTNRTAMALGSAGEPAGLIVTAAEQTAGRGRFTRVWHSPRGLNLYLSILLRPRLSPRRLPELSMLTAIALHKALTHLEPDIQFGLKWPNDLWVQNRKISGILCEADTSRQFGLHAVLGLGLNINSERQDFPVELQETATSLKLLTGKNYSIVKILASILNAFEEYYNQWEQSPDFHSFIEIWNHFEILTGKHIEIQQQNSILAGIAQNINERGELMLLQDDSQKLLSVNAGDIFIKQK